MPLQKWTQPRLVLQSWRDASQGSWRTWSAEPFTIIGRGSRMSASGIYISTVLVNASGRFWYSVLS